MEIPKAQSHTPLMQQFWEIKSQHLDKVLLFRMGDFYEMFFDDAIKAAPLLNIALTSRSKAEGQNVPMCGVPYHSIGPQINKLLKAGLKVAICDQIESPQAAREAMKTDKTKKIVKRAVVRVVTPGLVYDAETLKSHDSNFVMSVLKKGESSFELAALDATTGELFTATDLSRGELSSWVEKFSPQEFILSEKDALPFETTRVVTVRSLKDQSVSDFLLEYARETQGEDIKKVLREPQTLKTDFLQLSPQTLRHLEIFKRTDGELEYSLCWAVDLTNTAMGARLLRKRLATPFRNKEEISTELDRVENLFNDFFLRSLIREKLKNIGDLERKVARLSNPLCNARDLRALGVALEVAVELFSEPAVKKLFPAETSKAIKTSDEIFNTLRDELPHLTKEGGLIKPGVSATLDEYVELATHAQTKLSDLEHRERTHTGINSLKIKYNSVFGYSFEVTKSNLDKVPPHFIRRQTIAQGERYITAELSELEQKILSSQTKRSELEFQIFSDLKNNILKEALHFLSLSSHIADLDVSASFAELASQQGYVRPQFSESGIELKSSRHPVLEKSMKEPFIPNDISLSESHCLLLTGPNMAGKSTLMRQVALTLLLAHVGSFVPAREAKLPLLKQIFTRIGAQDNVAQGLSTFMVEMTETAEIIKSATCDSLVILDEIGRGTSTYDGMSLAQGILEHFITNVKSYTFFATHYHELTDLAKDRSEIINGHMSIKEHKGSLIFLRKLQPGPANRSYGIDVAKQAGLPPDLTTRAQEILNGLIKHTQSIKARQLDLLDHFSEPEIPQESEESLKLKNISDDLKNIKIESMTPLQALNKLSDLQNLL